jgi:DNA-binding PadR family transcriptional regulator
LEGEGLISSRLENVGRGPARKVYEATKAGYDAYHKGVLDALSIHQQFYPPIQLGLAGLPSISQGEVIQALRSYREGLEKRWDQVQKAIEAQLPLPDHVEIMFDYSKTMLLAEIGWIDRMISNFKMVRDHRQEIKE